MADQDIETSYQAAIDAGKIHGAIICAIDSQHDYVYEKTMGQRTLLSGEKKDHKLDDVLFLASATKLMAAIAALACVQDGLLSLTGDLSGVAPELAAKQVLTGWSDAGEPQLEPQVRPITLEMLITHSSGLTYHFLDPPIGRWREKYTSQGAGGTERKNVEDTFNYPLSFQPGSDWMYSPGLDWAGRIVERVTSKTLGDYLRERIFEPLGITDAQFYPVTNEDMRARLVDLSPSDPEGAGKAVVGGMDMNLRTKGDFGGHGLFMTGPDYVKVLHSLLANDSKILQPATVDSMFSQRLTGEAAAGHQKKLAGPIGPHFRVGTAMGSKAGYGLGGLVTMEDVEGWYGKHTLTWGGGVTFAWFVDRKNDLCGITAIQSALPVDNAMVDGLKQVFRRDIYRKYHSWKEAAQRA